jgi:hypothetical protein
MQVEVLPPRVQYRHESDGSAQMFRIGRDLQQSFRSSAKQDAIDLTAVLKGKQSNLLRQSEHHVEIAYR